MSAAFLAISQHGGGREKEDRELWEHEEGIKKVGKEFADEDDEAKSADF